MSVAYIEERLRERATSPTCNADYPTPTIPSPNEYIMPLVVSLTHHWSARCTWLVSSQVVSLPDVLPSVYDGVCHEETLP